MWNYFWSLFYYWRWILTCLLDITFVGHFLAILRAHGKCSFLCCILHPTNSPHQLTDVNVFLPCTISCSILYTLLSVNVLKSSVLQAVYNWEFSLSDSYRISDSDPSKFCSNVYQFQCSQLQPTTVWQPVSTTPYVHNSFTLVFPILTWVCPTISWLQYTTSTHN